MDFHQLRRRMPALINEMTEDVTLDTENEIDEFVILANEGVKFDSEIPRFVYYESVHTNLRRHLALLEKEGFITIVSKANAPIYRMTESFLTLLARQNDPS
ncbi:MAG: hypothetical protein PVI99_07450 [Anaerolineales bacterium]|jgi:hypothetical protein